MKTLTSNVAARLFLLCTLITSIALINGCETNLPTQAEYEAYSFSTTDSLAGTWQPVFLSSAADVAVSAPQAATSPEFQAELSELAQTQGQLTESQNAAVNYWTNNPVLRWNEIALKLIAKYNLIPGPNADGTYTLPNPSNPSAIPNFPFSHPPYAVRALAYLSAAQFDALIVSAYYQREYNRPSPSVASSNISAAYPNSNLPSYPSGAAAIATISKDVLTHFFPLEKDYLEKLSQEHQNALLWAGVNVPSDIEAGVTIANQIVSLVINRAVADGMSNAQCPKSVSDSIKKAAFDRFGWQWDNIEIPPRPVGLVPLYGRVKMWSVEDVTTVRLPAPPAPGSPDYLADEALVRDYANNQTPEQRAIANFWEDGINTYTPPGHWNRLFKERALSAKLSMIRTARGLAYLNMAMMDAGIACWESKYYYHYPRPINLMPELRPIAGTPNFPSYPSGHATFSAAGSEIMAYIFPNEANTFRQMALEASISRVYGGIHWKFDCDEGTRQGIDVAGYTIARARTDGAD